MIQFSQTKPGAAAFLMRGAYVLAGLLSVLLAFTPAIGQTIPSTLDPSRRETPLDLSVVPAIRFLTSPDFPPFNYKDSSGALVGFNVDLARAICEVLDITCTVQDWPFDQIEQALMSGQGDAMIAGLAMNSQTGAKFDFSDTYFQFPARFVAPLPSAQTFSTGALKGLKIAVRKGSMHEKFAQNFFAEAQLVPFADEAQALQAVADGQADLFFGDGMRAAFWLNANPDCCTFVGAPYLRPDYFGQGLAVATQAGRDAVRLAIDHALARLQKSGQFDDLFLRWFPVSFY